MATKQRLPMKCGNCSLFRPGRHWDSHELCPKCRPCNRKDPCLVCIEFTQEQWGEIDNWLQGCRQKLQSRLDQIPQPSGRQQRAPPIVPVPSAEPEAGSSPSPVPAAAGSSSEPRPRSKGKQPAKAKPKPKKRSGPHPEPSRGADGHDRDQLEASAGAQPRDLDANQPQDRDQDSNLPQPDRDGTTGPEPRSPRLPQEDSTPVSVPRNTESRMRSQDRQTKMADRERHRSRSNSRSTQPDPRRALSPPSDVPSEDSDRGFRREQFLHSGFKISSPSHSSMTKEIILFAI